MASSTLITDYLGYGTAADRPATPSLPTGGIGLYYATDTNVLSAYVNGTWYTVSIGAVNSMTDGDILSNISGSSGPAAANTLTAILDHVFSSTQGSILYRGASAWTALAPGTSGDVLTTLGSGANPAWSAGGGGGSGALSLVSTQSLSGQSSAAWTGLNDGNNAYLLVTRGVGGGASITVGTGAGPTYASTDYYWSSIQAYGGGSYNGVGANNASSYGIAYANSSFWFANNAFWGIATDFEGGSDQVGRFTGGSLQATGPITAISLNATSTFSAGSASLYQLSN